MTKQDLLQELHNIIDNYCNNNQQVILQEFKVYGPQANDFIPDSKKQTMAKMWQTIKDDIISHFQMKYTYPIVLQDTSDTIGSVFDLTVFAFKECFGYFNLKINEICFPDKLVLDNKPAEIITEFYLVDYLNEALKKFAEYYPDVILTRDKELITSQCYQFLLDKLHKEMSEYRYFIIKLDNSRKFLNTPEEIFEYMKTEFYLERMIERRFVYCSFNKEFVITHPKKDLVDSMKRS